MRFDLEKKRLVPKELEPSINEQRVIQAMRAGADVKLVLNAETHEEAVRLIEDYARLDLPVDFRKGNWNDIYSLRSDDLTYEFNVFIRREDE